MKIKLIKFLIKILKYPFIVLCTGLAEVEEFFVYASLFSPQNLLPLKGYSWPLLFFIKSSNVLAVKFCSYLTYERIHIGEKIKSCSNCYKAFAQYNLLTHEKTHIGRKPYSYSSCNKIFKDHSTFIKHQKIHTGEKPCS